MGWLWASPPASKAPSEDKAAPQVASQVAPAIPPTKQPESDYGDPEIAKFMAQIQAEFIGKPSRPAASPPPPPPILESSQPAPALTPKSTSSSSSSWTSLWGTSATPPASSSASSPLPPPAAADVPQALDPLSESQLPTTMSCRAAFDAAFYCQSVGSQFHAIYRQGELRSCSEKWDDFWFCMRTRAYTGEVKDDTIRDHYRRREWAKYGPGKPSSQDVWESRDEMVPAGSAFMEEYPQPVVDDEAWRALEIERRRKIQEGLDRDARNHEQ